MRKVLQLLGVLDDADIDWLARSGTRLYVSAGTELIREKGSIESLYILLEGELAVCIQALGGKQIARLRPGEMIGELSFVDAQPPSASVVALTEAWLLAIPREMLVSQLAKDTSFAARFYCSIARFLSDRLRMTVARLGYGDAQQDITSDELVDASLDSISLAAVRFDRMLRRLRGETAPRND
jgi:CRP/FNR family transcriptional regulator, cyclic AMP receptor protein